MTVERMIELLKTEHECMLRKSHDECQSDCENCDLVQDDNELHEMYTDVLMLLEDKRPKLIPKEELINNPDHAWIEFRHFKKLGIRDRDDIEFLLESKARDNYGITWRCWTQQPSDADRKAVCWNDKHRRYYRANT